MRERNMTAWEVDPLLWRKQVRDRREFWEAPKYRVRGSSYPVEWVPYFSEEEEEAREIAIQLKKLGVKKPWRKAVGLVLGEFDVWRWLKSWERLPGVVIHRERGPLTEIEKWAFFPRGAVLYYYTYWDECEDCPHVFSERCSGCRIRRRRKVRVEYK